MAPANTDGGPLGSVGSRVTRLGDVQPITSTDGVTLALHDLGGRGPVLFVSHATGFHGRAYLPLANALSDRFHCVAPDYRGHGDSSTPADGSMDWNGFGRDAIAIVGSLAERPLFGFGHSKGGAALLMAELARPGTFGALVLFEPIVFPPDPERASQPNSMAISARRRRPEFDSFEHAFANYASKPPLTTFTAGALHAYVDHGFRPTGRGTIELKCAPESEARTFENGGSHRTFERLGEITCPVLVLAGRDRAQGPGAIAEAIAEALTRGMFQSFDQLSHFGPMEDPAEIANEIARFCTPSSAPSSPTSR